MIPPPNESDLKRNAEADFSKEEVDFLLERFDQTEPALQRQIIARFVLTAATERDRAEAAERRADALAKRLATIAKLLPVERIRRWAAGILNESELAELIAAIHGEQI